MITRRSFFWLAGVIPFLRLKPQSRERVGYMDVTRWFRENRHHQSVLLNGRDISDGCVWFDDTTGEAEVLLRDAAGEHYIDPNDRNRAASKILRGRIEVVG